VIFVVRRVSFPARPSTERIAALATVVEVGIGVGVVYHFVLEEKTQNGLSSAGVREMVQAHPVRSVSLGSVC